MTKQKKKSTEVIVDEFQAKRVVFVTDRRNTNMEIFQQFYGMLKYLSKQSGYNLPKVSILTIENLHKTKLKLQCLYERIGYPSALGKPSLYAYENDGLKQSVASGTIYLIDAWQKRHDDSDLYEDSELDDSLFDLNLQKEYNCRVYFYLRHPKDVIEDKGYSFPDKFWNSGQVIVDSPLVAMSKMMLLNSFKTIDSKEIEKLLNKKDYSLTLLWRKVLDLNTVIEYQKPSNDWNRNGWNILYPVINSKYAILASIFNATHYHWINATNTANINSQLALNEQERDAIIEDHNMMVETLTNVFTLVIDNLLENLHNGEKKWIKAIDNNRINELDTVNIATIGSNREHWSNFQLFKWDMRSLTFKWLNYIIQKVFKDCEKVNYAKQLDLQYWCDINFNFNTNDPKFALVESLESQWEDSGDYVRTDDRHQNVKLKDIYRANAREIKYVQNYYMVTGHIIIHHLALFFKKCLEYKNDQIGLQEVVDCTSHGNSINFEEYYRIFKSITLEDHKSPFISNMLSLGEIFKDNFPNYKSVIYRTFTLDTTGEKMGDRFALLISDDIDGGDEFNCIIDNFTRRQNSPWPIIPDSKGVIVIK